MGKDNRVITAKVSQFNDKSDKTTKGGSIMS